jgi:hypothetical protein
MGRMPTGRSHVSAAAAAAAAPRLRSLSALLALCLAIATTTGCAPSDKSKATKPKRGSAIKSQVPDPGPDAPGKRTAALGGADDACAERLHALSGPMLYYYAVHRRLPLDVNELRDIAGPDPVIDFTCPVSGKPYVYDPRGMPRGGGKPGIIVLCDPEPTHSGMRLCVTVEEPKKPADPLVTHVLAEPETTFHHIPPPSLPPPPTPETPGE